MISSTIPSAKYSCSASPLRLANGSTAIDGFSGSARASPSARRPARCARFFLPGLDLGFRPGARGLRANPVNAHRAGDVLDLLLTEVGEVDRQPGADLLERRAGHADAAGLGDRLQPSGDVDRVAEQVSAFDDHIADMDADHGQVTSALGSLHCNLPKPCCSALSIEPHRRRSRIRRRCCRRWLLQRIRCVNVAISRSRNTERLWPSQRADCPAPFGGCIRRVERRKFSERS